MHTCTQHRDTQPANILGQGLKPGGKRDKFLDQEVDVLAVLRVPDGGRRGVSKENAHVTDEVRRQL